MSDVVTHEESVQLQQLRQEVKRDIELAIANFKIWLLITVLSNVVLIGVPALYVFFNTTNTSNTALTLAMDSRKRLDDHGTYLSLTDSRLSALEHFLESKDGFKPPAPTAVPH